MVDPLDAWLDKARRIASSVVAVEETSIDDDAAWPQASMRALQEEGLAGLVVPEAYGGLGQGLYGLSRVTEILGYESGSVGLCFGMHCVGTAVIASKATEDHGERFLRPIAEGRHITTLALSEPGTGVHFYLPETRIETRYQQYAITGRKTFVTNGGHADSYVLSARSQEDEGDVGTFSCVLVPNKMDGIAWHGPWEGWGMRGNSSIAMSLDDVLIDKRDRLGSEDDQIWYVFHVVAPYFLIAMAGTYLGIAQRALDHATEHLQARSHSHTGDALADIDVLQHRLANLWTRVESTRRLVYWAAQEADDGGEKALPGLMAAKADVARCAVDTVNDCMTLCGGKEYRDASLLPRLLRDARAAHVMAPTTDVLLTWAGRALLGRPLLGD